MANVKFVRKTPLRQGRKADSPAPEPVGKKRKRRPTEKAAAKARDNAVDSVMEQTDSEQRSRSTTPRPVRTRATAKNVAKAQPEQQPAEIDEENVTISHFKAAAFPTLEAGEGLDYTSADGQHGIITLVEERFSGDEKRRITSCETIDSLWRQGRYTKTMSAEEMQWYCNMKDILEDVEQDNEIHFHELACSLRQRIIEEIFDETMDIYKDNYCSVRLLLGLSKGELAQIMEENIDAPIPPHILELKRKYPDKAIDPDTPLPEEILKAALFLKQEHLPGSLLGEWQAIDISVAAQHLNAQSPSPCVDVDSAARNIQKPTPLIHSSPAVLAEDQKAPLAGIAQAMEGSTRSEQSKQAEFKESTARDAFANCSQKEERVTGVECRTPSPLIHRPSTIPVQRKILAPSPLSHHTLLHQERIPTNSNRPKASVTSSTADSRPGHRPSQQPSHPPNGPPIGQWAAPKIRSSPGRQFQIPQGPMPSTPANSYLAPTPKSTQTELAQKAMNDTTRQRETGRADTTSASSDAQVTQQPVPRNMADVLHGHYAPLLPDVYKRNQQVAAQQPHFQRRKPAMKIDIPAFVIPEHLKSARRVQESLEQPTVSQGYAPQQDLVQAPTLTEHANVCPDRKWSYSSYTKAQQGHSNDLPFLNLQDSHGRSAGAHATPPSEPIRQAEQPRKTPPQQKQEAAKQNQPSATQGLSADHFKKFMDSLEQQSRMRMRASDPSHLQQEKDRDQYSSMMAERQKSVVPLTQASATNTQSLQHLQSMDDLRSSQALAACIQSNPYKQFQPYKHSFQTSLSDLALFTQAPTNGYVGGRASGGVSASPPRSAVLASPIRHPTQNHFPNLYGDFAYGYSAAHSPRPSQLSSVSPTPMAQPVQNRRPPVRNPVEPTSIYGDPSMSSNVSSPYFVHPGHATMHSSPPSGAGAATYGQYAPYPPGEAPQQHSSGRGHGPAVDPSVDSEMT